MKVKCSDCGSTGLAGTRMDRDCERCGGTGQVERPPPPSAPEWPDTHDSRLVEALCDMEELTDWEIQFAETVVGMVFNNIPLSSRQRTKAGEILENNSK